MSIPQTVQDALVKLVSDYDDLKTTMKEQTDAYNALAIAQAEAVASDGAVADEHLLVAEDLKALRQAIADAFPN